MPDIVQRAKQEAMIQVHAKVTSKGQITLLVALRKRLGIVAGDSILFKTIGNQVFIVPRRRKGVFAEYRGIGSGLAEESKQAILDSVREFRGEL